MVLHFCGCGRVGHRRFIFEKDPVSKGTGSFVVFAEVVVFADVMRRNRCEYLAKLACCECYGLMGWVRFFVMSGVCAAVACGATAYGTAENPHGYPA